MSGRGFSGKSGKNSSTTRKLLRPRGDNTSARNYLAGELGVNTSTLSGVTLNPEVRSFNGQIEELANNTKRFGNRKQKFGKAKPYPADTLFNGVPISELWTSKDNKGIAVINAIANGTFRYPGPRKPLNNARREWNAVYGEKKPVNTNCKTGNCYISRKSRKSKKSKKSRKTRRAQNTQKTH